MTYETMAKLIWALSEQLRVDGWEVDAEVEFLVGLTKALIDLKADE